MSDTDDETAARLARLIAQVEKVARKAREAGLVVVAGELARAIEEAKQESHEESPR
jgi:uridylate kinase